MSSVKIDPPTKVERWHQVGKHLRIMAGAQKDHCTLEVEELRDYDMTGSLKFSANTQRMEEFLSDLHAMVAVVEAAIDRSRDLK